ncbi:MAG TPA: hypothetical protein VME43_16140 [Bryobacteraceae bacterium]|nr:hypothetical protein [Bryobacteraceae bacterium]
MRRIKVVAVSLMAALAFSVHAAPQADNLAQQLRAVYPETEMDANGLKVVKPGAVLVVQADGLQANPMKSGPFANTFAEGQFVRTESRSEKAARFGLAIPQRRQVERPVAVGAKVYLLNTEFNPDSIVFVVQTCGDCDPKAVDPGFQPYRAKVTFKFVRGALADTDAKHVRQTIEQVFKFPEGAAPAAEPQAPPPPAQAPPPPQQQFAPIAPPAPPPPPSADQAPRVLKLGMTMQQVKDGFGEPASIVDLGSKVIYVYKDKKVTFVNGKVSDVDVQ